MADTKVVKIKLVKSLIGTSPAQRKVLQSPKFYYFDIGVVNHLLHRRNLSPGSTDFGHAFEHFIIQEIIAFLSYTDSYEQLSYWRTSTGYEVDAVIGNGRIAIEIKSSEEIQSKHTKGLKAFEEEVLPNSSINSDKFSLATDKYFSASLRIVFFSLTAQPKYPY